MILKVEAGGGMSGLISWKLFLKSNQGLKWQLKGANEQSYTTQVSNMFSPMVEERHFFLHKNVSTSFTDDVDNEP